MNNDAEHQNPAAVIANMSSVASASFGSNDNTADVGKIGYVTKEGMQLFGTSADAETGQTTYHYTKRIGRMSWNDADKAIKKLNEDSALTDLYGEASFPTDERTMTNELNMLFENKEALDITDKWIHGEGFHVDYSRCLDCDNGDQCDYSKNGGSTAFPVWRVDRLVI